jgi:hypothetical protein
LRVGEMRGDLRTHRARAEHGSFFYPNHKSLIILNEYSFSKGYTQHSKVRDGGGVRSIIS